jgi:hypothetical protein
MVEILAHVDSSALTGTGRKPSSTVLARVVGELLQNQRGVHRPKTYRAEQPQHLVPIAENGSAWWTLTISASAVR